MDAEATSKRGSLTVVTEQPHTAAEMTNGERNEQA
jgi:hypothetical protein